MRATLILLSVLLVGAPEAFARSRAVGHRGKPWEAPACTVSRGLPSFGSMHGTTVVRPEELSDPWSNIVTAGLALGATPNTLYATRGGAIYESTDGGCTWGVRADVAEVLIGRRAYVITKHPHRIYAYTASSHPAPQYLVRIIHQTVETFRTPDVMHRIEVDPADPMHLRGIGLSGFVRDSFDGGRTWKPVGMATVSRVLASEFDPTNFDRIILHTGAFGTVAITTDGGKSWTYAQQTWWRVDALEISPADPNVVWLSGAAGLENPDLYRSTDGGKTFVKAVDYTSMLSHSMSSSLAAHPTDPNVLAVPLNVGTAMVDQSGVRQIWTGAGESEMVWSPAGTLYFIDQQFRY